MNSSPNLTENAKILAKTHRQAMFIDYNQTRLRKCTSNRDSTSVNRSQLVPFFVPVFEHHVVGCRREILGLVSHPFCTLFKPVETLASLQHELVGPVHLTSSTRYPVTHVLKIARNMLGHRFVGFSAGFAN